MRTLVSFILLVAMLQGQLIAQAVTISPAKKSIVEVLEQISDEHGIQFSYSHNSFPAEEVFISAENEELSVFLNRILKPYGLGFEFIEGTFIAIKPIEDVGFYLRFIVVDEEDRLPLEFAQFQIIGEYKGTQTGLDGSLNYFLRDPAHKEIEISYLGYVPFRASAFDLFYEEPDTIFLKKDPIQLDGIVVTEYLNNGVLVSENSSSLQIRPSTLNVMPGMSEPDAMYSLQQLPGVSSQDESASDISIRGGTSDQVAIYWEDIPVYHSAHYFGLISSFIPSSVSRINVYRNSIPAKFGGSVSGLIDMGAEELPVLKPEFQTDLNLTHASGSGLAPFSNGKGAFYIAARRSINDFYTTPTFESYNRKLFDGSRLNELQDFAVTEEFEVNSNLRFWDINSKLSYDLSDKQRVSTSFFWGKNVLDFLSVDEDLRTADFQYHEIEHWGVNASWSARWNNRWSTSVIISNSAYKLNYEYLYQREIIPDEEEEGIIDKAWLKDEDEEDDGEGDEDEEDNENEEDEDEDTEENEEDLEDPNEGDGFFDDRFEDAPDSLQDRGSWNNSLNNTEIKVVQSLSLQNANLDLGFQYNHLEIKYALREENLFDEDKVQGFYEKGSSFALFSDFSLGRGYSYSIDIGSRINYFEFVDVFTIDPQFSGSYSPTNWFTLKASGGTYHQLIRTLRDFENSISNTSEEIWFVSDAEEIPVIKNQQLNAGFLIQHRGWLFDVEAYTKKLTGLSTFNYSFGSGSIDDYEEGEETIRGVDVLLRKRFARHRSWVSYSYSKSESFFEDISEDPFPSSLDQPHKLTISQSYSTPKFEISLGWTVKSGIPYTAPVSDEAERVITIIAEDDNDADNLEEQYYAIQYDGINNRRLPVYHRLDASFWFFFSGRSPSGFNGKLGISMLNMLNQENVHTRNFFVDDDPDFEENDFVEVFREERYLLGFTPNITLSLRF